MATLKEEQINAVQGHGWLQKASSWINEMIIDFLAKQVDTEVKRYRQKYPG